MACHVAAHILKYSSPIFLDKSRLALLTQCPPLPIAVKTPEVKKIMDTNTQSNANALHIPTLESQLALHATFGAFKIEDKVSFARKYDPRVQELPNFRHAIVRYRNTDKSTVEKLAQMVTVPQLVLPEEYELLDEKARKVILGLYEDEQDNIIRSLIDAGVSNIRWDALSVSKVLESLTAVRLSNRLTKEQIENWARIALKDVSYTRADQISNEKSFNAEQKEKQRAGTLNAYVTLAMKLAAPVPNVGQHEVTALKNMMSVAKLADDMSKVLFAKIDAILNPKIVANVDL